MILKNIGSDNETIRIIRRETYPSGKPDEPRIGPWQTAQHLQHVIYNPQNHNIKF